MELSQDEKDALDPQGAVIRQMVEAGTGVATELEALNPNVEIDAKEFGEHVRNGGWRLGLLVARSVEAGAGEGGDHHRSRVTGGGKISATAFAKQSGNVSRNTVLKYLSAWDQAAADGLVPVSSKLRPGQGFTFELEDGEGADKHTAKKWNEYFSPKSDDDTAAVIKLMNAAKSFIAKEATGISDQQEHSPADVVKMMEKVIIHAWEQLKASGGYDESSAELDELAVQAVSFAVSQKEFRIRAAGMPEE